MKKDLKSLILLIIIAILMFKSILYLGILFLVWIDSGKLSEAILWPETLVTRLLNK